MRSCREAVRIVRALRRLAALAALAAVGLGGGDAVAKGGTVEAHGSVPFELQLDHVTRSDDPGGDVSNLSTTIEPQATVTFARVPGLSVYAHATLEQVREPDPDENRFFADEGLYIEDLYLRYETGPFAVQGGKFNPGFGIAWDKAPGIYGTDMAEDYEIAERIGVLGAVTLPLGPLGPHTISAAAFFLDTTFLSESALTSRGRTDRSDGGVSNTEDLASWSVVLQSEAFAGIKGLAPRLSVIGQAHGVDGDSDERGYAAALTYRAALPSKVTLAPLVEFVSFHDADGIGGKKRRYLTLALEAARGPWSASAAYTGRTTQPPGAADEDDYQLTATVGYTFASGIGLNAGVKTEEIGGESTDTVGLLATYTLTF